MLKTKINEFNLKFKSIFRFDINNKGSLVMYISRKKCWSVNKKTALKFKDNFLKKANELEINEMNQAYLLLITDILEEYGNES